MAMTGSAVGLKITIIKDQASAMPVESSEESQNDSERRSAERYDVRKASSGSSRFVASIILSSGRSVFVNLQEVSRLGASAKRRGDLQITDGETVNLSVYEEENGEKLTIPCRVEWVKVSRGETSVGLSFQEGPLLPGTMFDDFLDQALLAPKSTP